MVGGVRLFVPYHSGSNMRRVPDRSYEMVDRQRTNPPNSSRGLWTQDATGLDTSDFFNYDQDSIDDTAAEYFEKG